MTKFKIKIHSAIDLITNSSTEIFTVDNSIPRWSIYDILRAKATYHHDMEWFDKELSIYEDNEENTIVINSFLNDPDWFCDFIHETFNVLKHD